MSAMWEESCLFRAFHFQDVPKTIFQCRSCTGHITSMSLRKGFVWFFAVVGFGVILFFLSGGGHELGVLTVFSSMAYLQYYSSEAAD